MPLVQSLFRPVFDLDVRAALRQGYLPVAYRRETPKPLTFVLFHRLRRHRCLVGEEIGFLGQSSIQPEPAVAVKVPLGGRHYLLGVRRLETLVRANLTKKKQRSAKKI